MNTEKAISRSSFLRNGLKHFGGAMSEAVENSVKKTLEKAVIPMHRPPGAVGEAEFLSLCTRCDKCLEACPHDSILRAGAKYGAAIGTPMIKPEDKPCRMCEDYPCISACPEPVLSHENSKIMGTAHVINSKCLTFSNQVCDYCYDCCPVKGEAIKMDNGKPRVNNNFCTGCGLCEYYCPAPGNGIKVIPKKLF